MPDFDGINRLWADSIRACAKTPLVGDEGREYRAIGKQPDLPWGLLADAARSASRPRAHDRVGKGRPLLVGRSFRPRGHHRHVRQAFRERRRNGRRHLGRRRGRGEPGRFSPVPRRTVHDRRPRRPAAASIAPWRPSGHDLGQPRPQELRPRGMGAARRRRVPRFFPADWPASRMAGCRRRERDRLERPAGQYPVRRVSLSSPALENAGAIVDFASRPFSWLVAGTAPRRLFRRGRGLSPDQPSRALKPELFRDLVRRREGDFDLAETPAPK